MLRHRRPEGRGRAFRRETKTQFHRPMIADVQDRPMLPLAGVKVVELGQNLAGPYGAEILATLGADVVKVERPEGDDIRYWGQPAGESSPAFHAMNYNKRSMVIDFDDPAALAWLRQYASEC